MTRTTMALDSVDDYLGPAANRFFGAGYRRSEIDLEKTTVSQDQVHGILSVRYPSDWSRKKTGIDLRPHLSTVDGLVVAAQLTDALLTSHFCLSPEDRARTDLSKVVIRAGTEPDEDLGTLPVEARIRRTTALDARYAITVVDVGVGRMRLRCRATHPGSPAKSAAADRAAPDLLGDSRFRFWGDGYRSSRQTIGNVAADLSAQRATADIATAPLPAAMKEGIDGTPPRVTLIDAFVSSLQLFQILLYELDGLDRTESNTLWMQHTTLEMDPDRRDTNDLAVNITESELLALPSGTWRNVSFDANAGPVRQRSTFAHNLPHTAATSRVHRPGHLQEEK